MSTIEVIALILIGLAAIKILALLYKPEIWFNIIEKVYSVPQLIFLLALILSATVLYFLINAGLTITEILAVCMFVVLLIMMGMASYSDELIVWFKQQNMSSIIKRTWIYSVVWILLLAWGVKEIIFN